MAQLKIKKERWEREYKNGDWDYLESNPAERARSAIIAMYCRHYFPQGKILDVGSGQGTLTDFLNARQKRRYLGLDICQAAAEKARVKKIKIINQDFTSFQSANQFDIIVLNEVLYYLEEKEALTKTIAMLRQHGLVIISLYRMKGKRYDLAIRKESGKLFTTLQSVEIKAKVKKQTVIWRIEVLRPKKWSELNQTSAGDK